MRKYFIVLIFALISQALFANAGTPLMWLSIGHLFLGNILLGIIEGIIVSLLYKTKFTRSVLIMIAGNYASWLIGSGLIMIFQDKFIYAVFRLDTVFALWIISLVILYVLTVAIEVFFFRWALNKNNKAWKWPIKVSVWINLITYSAMILLYLNASKYNFFTDLKINQSLLSNKGNIDITYVLKKTIYHKTLSDNNPGREVCKLPHLKDGWHFGLKKDSLKNIYSLQYVNNKGEVLPICYNYLSDNDRGNYSESSARDWDNRLTADFRDSTKMGWEVHFGFWAIDGLTITHTNKERKNYAFDVPWMAWSIRKVSIVNDAEIICLFGNRIILLNKDSKEIAFIAKGNDYIIKRK